MKHSGKARKAAFKLIMSVLGIMIILCLLVFASESVRLGFSVLSSPILNAALTVCCTSFILFSIFTLCFFRDPEAKAPSGANRILSPAHGKVDVIAETNELEFIAGPCRRISVFLSLFDVHVQNAPVDGKVIFFKHKPGQFLNALRTDCAAVNENILIGFAPKERPAEKVGVRLVAGVLARRIVPWVAAGDEVAHGERIGLIQFGSRVEVYLPLSAKIQVELGGKVAGGETVIATFQ
jgi:phosphatidylserine decarboxylase